MPQIVTLNETLRDLVLRQYDENRNVRRIGFQLDQFRLLLLHAHQRLALSPEGGEITIKGKTFRREANRVRHVKH